MDVFVYREPKGFETRDLEGIEELAEQLGQYGLLTPDSEVKVEITAPWQTIEDLLSLIQFYLREPLGGSPSSLWFNPGLDRHGIPKE